MGNRAGTLNPSADLSEERLLSLRQNGGIFHAYEVAQDAESKLSGVTLSPLEPAITLRFDDSGHTGPAGRARRAAAERGADVSDFMRTQAMSANVVVRGLQYGPGVDRDAMLPTCSFLVR